MRPREGKVLLATIPNVTLLACRDMSWVHGVACNHPLQFDVSALTACLWNWAGYVLYAGYDGYDGCLMWTVEQIFRVCVCTQVRDTMRDMRGKRVTCVGCIVSALVLHSVQ